MSNLRKYLPFVFIVSVIVSVLSACSTQKNTSASRFWHSFTAKYNTYYNGSQAYIEGSLAKENGNKDNYTEQIPLYTVGNKESRQLGKGNFETAITKAQKAIKQHSIKKRPEWTKNRKKTEKDIEWLNRREYNPFIWKAWMLMGRSQFYSGAFDEAAATFSYMSRLFRTQPAIYGKSRAWLAKCYIQQDWLYDAEDVIRNMKRDSIAPSAQKEWDYTYADYYLHTGNLEEAVVYLKKVIKHEMRSKQKAREYFLLGQILAAQHRDAEAYAAYRKCVAKNPPYELEFNARIAMTEVMPQGAAKSKIAKLRRMARSDKNAEYLDQVYYAMGNVYLAERDTTNAIGAYEQGNKKATRAGVEKGVLLLHLGDLYWQKEKFGDARRCYGEAIGLLDKERPDYHQLSERSKILDELAPFTDAVYLQDSLQALAKMSEKDRNAAIDRVIDALKKKEKEERLNELEAKVQQHNAANNTGPRTNQAPQMPGQGQPGTFYFYNPTAVQQGKQTFAKQWGKRENTDDWQRMNKTVVAGADGDMYGSADGADGDIAASDSLSADGAQTEEKKDSAALDPHKREYYLAQIPFTDEQLQASNEILADGLFNSGIIFKDKLDNLPLSEKALVRLNTTFPDFARSEDVYYHMFLLYSRKGKHSVARQFRDLLDEKFPESQWTKIVTDPYFEENARFGVHREDSLYAETYDAFRSDSYDVVSRNASISEHRYPYGAHRDKFLFIGGLSRLNQGDADSCLHAMERVVKDFPQSEVATMAGMIINGVKAGKKLHGAKFDMTDIWNYRSEALSESADTTEQRFSDDPLQEFVFVMTYNPDSLSENKLLFELAKYNFTSYLVRNFDIDIEEFGDMHRLTVSGFQNFDEAHIYARKLYQNSHLMSLCRDSRNIIISKSNLALLGTRYSYNDYDDFYSTHFAPLPIPESSLLNELVVDPQLYDPENQPSTAPASPTTDDDTLPLDNGTIALPEDDGTIALPEDDGTIAIPENDGTIAVPETTGTTIPDEPAPVQSVKPIVDKKPAEDKKPVESAKPNESAKPVESAKVPEKQASSSSPVGQSPVAKTPVKKQTTTVRQDINSNVLEIIDESAPKQKTTTSKTATTTPKKQQQKDDDEYFDFDGF